MKRSAPSAPAPNPIAPAQAPLTELIGRLDRYEANFDLMLSTWQAKDIHDVVSEEYTVMLGTLSEHFPEAAVVAMDLVASHNEAVSALLELHTARRESRAPLAGDNAIAALQQRHRAAVRALRDILMRKTH